MMQEFLRKGLAAELDLAEEELYEGFLSPEEYNERVTTLERGYREEALEAARAAYEEELIQW